MGRTSSTMNTTLELFRKGLTPDEIAKRRELAVSTVYTHLENYVKEGKIDVFKLIDKQTFNTIKSAIDIVGTWVLSRIKENCPDNINYTEIRLVVAHLDHINRNKNEHSQSEVISPTKTYITGLILTPAAKEFFENLCVRNYKTLSPAVKSIISKHFKSYLDLLPWVRNRSKDFKAYTGGERFLERELSTFITTLRSELVENGFDFNLQKKNDSTVPQTPKITSITAEEAHLKVKELKPSNTNDIEKRLQEPKYPLYNNDYLREQYHNLICAYPPRARKILIDHIPTVEDFYRKVLVRGVEFSSRLEDKTALDKFIDIFKQIYDDYFSHKLNAVSLFTSQMQMKPYNNLTSEETTKLDRAEHPDKYKDEELHNLWDFGSFPELPKPRFQHVDSGDLCFCHLLDEPPVIDYYDPDTAYEDLMVLAITAVQAGKPIIKSLYGMRYDFYFEKAEIASFSESQMSVYLSESDDTRKRTLYRGERYIYYFDEYDFSDNRDNNKRNINKTTDYFDKLIEMEKEFRRWLSELRKVVDTISKGRLIVYSDYYKIRVFDTSNNTSCSIYTFINWIEKFGIRKVAARFFVTDGNNPVNRNYFPGKYHF